MLNDEQVFLMADQRRHGLDSESTVTKIHRYKKHYSTVPDILLSAVWHSGDYWNWNAFLLQMELSELKGIQCCSLLTSSCLNRCGHVPNSPYRVLSYSPGITQNHLDKSSQGGDALSFGFPPPCQRAKITHCPSVSRFPFVFNCELHQLGPKWKSQAWVWIIFQQIYTPIRKPKKAALN